MSRNDRDRLCDVLVACSAIRSYLARADIDGDLVFDAIRIRLVEVVEAIKDLDPKQLDHVTSTGVGLSPGVNNASRYMLVL